MTKPDRLTQAVLQQLADLEDAYTAAVIGAAIGGLLIGALVGFLACHHIARPGVTT